MSQLIEEITRDFLSKAEKSNYFFQLLSRRNYPQVNGYFSYKEVAKVLAGYRLLFDSQKKVEEDSDLYTFLLGSIALNNDVPTFWLKKPLLESFTVSKIPEPLPKINQVVPWGIIMLPSGVIKTPEGENLNWIFFRHLLETEDCLKGADDETKNRLSYHENKSRKSCLFWLTTTKKGINYYQDLDLEKILIQLPETMALCYWSQVIGLENNEENNKQFSDLVASVLIQCLFYFHLKPEELKPEQKKGFGTNNNQLNHKKDKKNKGLWQPIFIGNDYQIKQEKISPGKGTHNSPKPHWRRGHWHTVLYGEGKQQRKIIWFPPVLVKPQKS